MGAQRGVLHLAHLAARQTRDGCAAPLGTEIARPLAEPPRPRSVCGECRVAALTGDANSSTMTDLSARVRAIPTSPELDVGSFCLEHRVADFANAGLTCAVE